MIPPLSNIIISRTDSIGDVVLTLPMARLLKNRFPGIKIGFLGKNYTRPVIEACRYIDHFIDLDEFLSSQVTISGEKPQAIIHVFPLASIAKRAKTLNIPLRIGTTNRIYHWTTCNRLVPLSRKNSDLHEAQLNMKLLGPLGIDASYSLEQLGSYIGLTRLQALPERFASLIDPSRYNLILHPKSQGSAREWGLDNFVRLVKLLDKTRFKVFISGTDKERLLIQPLLEQLGGEVTDIAGLMSLQEFMAFIGQCQGLVANSTGPLHIAAALGKDAYGIYPPMRPIHPGRWAPLGPKAKVFVLDKDCSDCTKSPSSCTCITAVSPESIMLALEQSYHEHRYEE